MLRGAPGPANPSLPAASTPTVRSSPNGRAGTCGRAPTRKKAEESLAESEAKLKQVADMAREKVMALSK
eukprot:COSAG06_NODE_20531_length_792_cov_1.142857_1_plen_68_part_10